VCVSKIKTDNIAATNCPDTLCDDPNAVLIGKSRIIIHKTGNGSNKQANSPNIKQGLRNREIRETRQKVKSQATRGRVLRYAV